jgi:hypothetical protein
LAILLPLVFLLSALDRVLQTDHPPRTGTSTTLVLDQPLHHRRVSAHLANQVTIAFEVTITCFDSPQFPHPVSSSLGGGMMLVGMTGLYQRT